MNENDIIKNQGNPYKEFDPTYDVLPLPSKGLFYPKINGQTMDSVNVAYLTAADESVMMSQNLIESGEMLNELLKRKVKSDYPVEKLLVGDRLAILVFLRSTMEPNYHTELIDPETGKKFEHTVDLTSLTLKEVEELPDQNGYYEFKLPRSGRLVKFRLMTGEDEKAIKNMEKAENRHKQIEENLWRQFKFERLVVEVEGIDDQLKKSHFLRNMPIMDARRLSKYMDDVTPTIDLKIDVPSPSGGNFRTDLPITKEFLYPSI